MADTMMVEIRDRGTTIVALAIRPGGEADSVGEQRLWQHAGYGNADAQEQYVLLAQVGGGTGKITCDPFEWGNRTMREAHRWLKKHWFDIHADRVIDVAFILGEAPAPKASEVQR